MTFQSPRRLSDNFASYKLLNNGESIRCIRLHEKQEKQLQEELQKQILHQQHLPSVSRFTVKEVRKLYKSVYARHGSEADFRIHL